MRGDMTSTRWRSSEDKLLLAALQKAVDGAGAVPQEFTEDARSAFDWRSRDAGVTRMSLVFDSSTAGMESVLAPTDHTPPLLLLFTT